MGITFSDTPLKAGMRSPQHHVDAAAYYRHAYGKFKARHDGEDDRGHAVGNGGYIVRAGGKGSQQEEHNHGEGSGHVGILQEGPLFRDFHGFDIILRLAGLRTYPGGNIVRQTAEVAQGDVVSMGDAVRIFLTNGR